MKDIYQELKKKNNFKDFKKENHSLKYIFNSNNNDNAMTPNRAVNISQFEESPKGETEDPTKLKDNYDKFKAYYKTILNE